MHSRIVFPPPETTTAAAAATKRLQHPQVSPYFEIKFVVVGFCFVFFLVGERKERRHPLQFIPVRRDASGLSLFPAPARTVPYPPERTAEKITTKKKRYKVRSLLVLLNPLFLIVRQGMRRRVIPNLRLPRNPPEPLHGPLQTARGGRAVDSQRLLAEKI